MASARISRLATEVAPAQFVTVMRQRASKMLDTIHEEDQRDMAAAASEHSFSSAASLPPSSSPAMPHKFVFRAFKGRISAFRR